MPQTRGQKGQKNAASNNAAKNNVAPIVPLGAPKLTKESFEKELQDLAAMAKEQTWVNWARQQLWVLIRAATFLVLAALYSNLSQLTLAPVFGSIPASIWHSRGIVVSCFIGWCSNMFLDSKLPYKPELLLPLLAASIPFIQFTLFQHSRMLGALYGPVIIEGVTFFPLLTLSVSSLASATEDLKLNPGLPSWIGDAMPGLIAWPFFKFMENCFRSILQNVIGTSFFWTRLGMQLGLTGLYSVLAPSRRVIYTIFPLLHTLLLNIHAPTQMMTSSLNATMNEMGWSLLARQESITGYLSVLDSKQAGFRVMRCDHSLLGGEWQRDGGIVKEPIYGIFAMLEAVRLIEVPVSVPDEHATALVVGLGIGTTPAALITHGISTTIVEIDPVVYKFATEYFSLPANHTAVIEDAVSYASSAVASGQTFDYIVHDVFTGGAEPVNLFTFEFMSDLRSLLKPNGAIAINYAGDISLPSARVIIHTILSSFPTCRIYREYDAATSSKIQEEGKDFANMVIFCTNAPSGTIEFRKPKNADYLKTYAREKFLVPKHEVIREEYALQESDGGVLLRNDTARIETWHQTSALGHWELMRNVLPDFVWQNW